MVRSYTKLDTVALVENAISNESLYQISSFLEQNKVYNELSLYITSTVLGIIALRIDIYYVPVGIRILMSLAPTSPCVLLLMSTLFQRVLLDKK